LSEVRTDSDEARHFDPAKPGPELRSHLRQLFQSARIVQGTSFRARILGRWAAWEKLPDNQLVERIKQLAEDRRQLLLQRDRMVRGGKTLSTADQAHLHEVEAELKLGRFEQNVREYAA